MHGAWIGLGVPDCSRSPMSERAPPGFEVVTRRRRRRRLRDGNEDEAKEECSSEEAAEIDEEDVALQAALKASADMYELSSKSREVSLESIMELSKEADEKRRKELQSALQGDEDALALAIELSKQEPDAHLAIALDASKKESIPELDPEEEASLVQEALRRSKIEHTSSDTSSQLPPGLLTPSALLDRRQVRNNPEADDDSQQIRLALQLSEQVESLEKVLDEEEAQEEIKFAIEASRVTTTRNTSNDSDLPPRTQASSGLHHRRSSSSSSS